MNSSVLLQRGCSSALATDDRHACTCNHWLPVSKIAVLMHLCSRCWRHASPEVVRQQMRAETSLQPHGLSCVCLLCRPRLHLLHHSTLPTAMPPKRAQNTSARVDAIKALRAAAQTQLKALRSDLKKAHQPICQTHCPPNVLERMQREGLRDALRVDACSHPWNALRVLFFATRANPP